MGRNRKTYREKKKREKRQEHLFNGLPGMKNEYGRIDLTPYNAARVARGQLSEQDIRY